MAQFKDLPIKSKLRRMSAIVSASVLLLACLAFVAYDIATFKNSIAARVRTGADIVSINVTPALLFRDQGAATETLGALRVSPTIISAAVYALDGKLFAKYVRRIGGDSAVLPETLDVAGGAYRVESSDLIVHSPIVSDGKTIGVVSIHSDLSEIATRVRDYLQIALIVLALSFAIAWGVSSRLEKKISGPILSLTQTSRTITSQRDYSLRARVETSDEIGILGTAFNDMLDEVGRRAHAIEESNRALQHEMAERRLGEQKIRAQLEHLNLLDQITRAIGERQDLRSIFQVVVGSVEESLPVDFGCICMYHETARELNVMCVGSRSAALAHEMAMDERSSISVDANGLARCIAGELVYEPDIGDVRYPFPERLARGGLGSVVMAPLKSEDRVFGVLVAARREAQGFSSVECEFLRQLSEHVALAAHQAQLYDALQHAYDDLRQTQQSVMQQERLRALGQMASGIAHDINNALSPVSLYAESMLEMERNLSERGRGYLQTIQRAVGDVAQTVARMREFYRQRDTPIELAPVQINALVQQVLDLTRARWSDMPLRQGVVIEALTQLASDLPQAMGVESEIREALTNLVFNAVDAMPAGGTLTLRTRFTTAQPPTVVVEIADSGIGMDEETRRRCLEPFFTTKGERGTGLGLAMVFGTMQRHGADIEIESTLGIGTVVRLLFPVAEAISLEPGKLTEPRAQPSRLRLLLIDDDPILLKSLRDTLETDGHVIVSANGGEDGISVFRAAFARGEAFAAVITDLGMPHVDGRKVAEAVKTTAPDTPVILLTGWGQRLMAEGDIPPCVDRVLAKPPKLRELRQVLAHLCPTTTTGLDA
jgi:signal transduction histidine kinase/ActR/RegA family two-component response regulator/HAMP domain-containing protein